MAPRVLGSRVTTLTNQNPLFCRVPIGSINGFILGTYKIVGSGWLRRTIDILSLLRSQSGSRSWRPFKLIVAADGCAALPETFNSRGGALGLGTSVLTNLRSDDCHDAEARVIEGGRWSVSHHTGI